MPETHYIDTEGGRPEKEKPFDCSDDLVTNIIKFLCSKVIIWIIVFEVIGIIIGLNSNIDSEWYNSLNLPPLQPPGEVFGIAWSILYFLLAIVGYQLFEAEDEKKFDLFIPFAIQMLFNWSWNPVFFNAEEPAIALIIITVIATITTYLFVELVKIGGFEKWLVLPYLAWIYFATYLNTYIVRNN